jgi:hypothetical protein
MVVAQLIHEELKLAKPSAEGRGLGFGWLWGKLAVGLANTT